MYESKDELLRHWSSAVLILNQKRILTVNLLGQKILMIF